MYTHKEVPTLYGGLLQRKCGKDCMLKSLQVFLYSSPLPPSLLKSGCYEIINIVLCVPYSRVCSVAAPLGNAWIKLARKQDQHNAVALWEIPPGGWRKPTFWSREGMPLVKEPFPDRVEGCSLLSEEAKFAEQTACNPLKFPAEISGSCC